MNKKITIIGILIIILSTFAAGCVETPIETHIEDAIIETINNINNEFDKANSELNLASENIVPSDLAAFFNEFDIDGNGELDLGESQNFFYWVEDNIVYRWDCENQQNPGGFPVGDGRPGVQFWQPPYITWIEGAGDCEDMAMLQVAFFNHFGISAYVALVNAEGREIDHAIAIVAMGGTPEEFADMLGDFVYYELEGGYYMLVDNAYSNAFGFLCGGSREGQFYIIEQHTIEETLKLPNF